MKPRPYLLSLVATLLLLPALRSPAGPVPSVTIGQNFTGNTFGNPSQAVPPDSNGVIGPGYFVEFINGAFAIYNRTNGQSVKRISDAKFWSNAGVVLSSSDEVTDPRVIYDPTSQRWFASMVDADATAADPATESNDFLLAVSATSDPRGAWHGFLFQADPDTGSFADFPTLGVDGNAVYLSGDMFVDSLTPVGPSLWSFPKADLLAATPSILNATWFGVMDYGQRGQVLQPATCFDGSSSGKILAVSDIGNDSSLHSNLVCSAVQNAGSPGATLSPATFIPTLPWEVPDNGNVGAPCFAPIQPDGTDTLQANDARLSAKVYAVGGVLYAVHNTYLNNRVAIRWYRVRAADNTLLESGTISDPDLDLFFPSIAANSSGVVVIGFNGCSIDTYISCYAMAGQTINGVTTFGPRQLLQSSQVDYHDLYEQSEYSTTSRWGDYSTTSVDPADPNRFWTIQLYALSDPTYTSIWATQITELITTPAAAPVLLGIQKSGNNVLVSWPAGSSNYQLQVATNLVGTVSWSNVSQTPATNGAQLVATLPLAPGSRFFRLLKQ